MAGRNGSDVTASVTAGRALEDLARASYRPVVVTDEATRHRGQRLLGRLRCRLAA
jgi:hypothetical protein